MIRKDLTLKFSPKAFAKSFSQFIFNVYFIHKYDSVGAVFVVFSLLLIINIIIGVYIVKQILLSLIAL